MIYFSRINVLFFKFHHIHFDTSLSMLAATYSSLRKTKKYDVTSWNWGSSISLFDFFSNQKIFENDIFSFKNKFLSDRHQLLLASIRHDIRWSFRRIHMIYESFKYICAKKRRFEKISKSVQENSLIKLFSFLHFLLVYWIVIFN